MPHLLGRDTIEFAIDALVIGLVIAAMAACALAALVRDVGAWTGAW
jgi:hypothetical protein